MKKGLPKVRNESPKDCGHRDKREAIRYEYLLNLTLQFTSNKNLQFISEGEDAACISKHDIELTVRNILEDSGEDTKLTFLDPDIILQGSIFWFFYEQCARCQFSAASKAISSLALLQK